MLMDSTSLYGQEAAQDQMTAGYHQQQIQNFGAAGTQALNVAGAEGNIARGQLAQASQMGSIGAQYGGLGSQLDARAGRALGVGMQYEGMGYQALQDQTSIANRRVERQDKFRMSDAAARSRVDSYNRSRGARGIGNVMKVAEVAARVYAAGATGGGSELAIAAMKAAKAKQEAQNRSRASSAGDNKMTTNRSLVSSSSVRDASFDNNAWRKRTGQIDTSVTTPAYDDYNAGRFEYPQLDMSNAYKGSAIYSSIPPQSFNSTPGVTGPPGRSMQEGYGWNYSDDYFNSTNQMSNRYRKDPRPYYG
jgi:hypothetical protein